MHARPRSTLVFLPPRGSRWALALLGLAVLGQGLAKAVDPTGYMAALDAFHVLKPTALAPLSLGALALMWTVLEILAGVALLYGGLTRTPARELTLAGLMLALGLWVTYLVLGVGASARALAVANWTAFGSLLAVRLTWGVLLQEALMIATLGWLILRVSRWPSAPRHAGTAARPRALSHA